jgi:hypothetical protein
MNMDTAISILTFLVGIGVSIMLSGIPWAYSVHGRLATIETSLRDAILALARLNDMERRLVRIETLLNETEIK